MKVTLREIDGPWDAGWVLDKHTISSTPIGQNEYGYTVFDTKRTEAGESTFQLKYRQGWEQAPVLAQAIADEIYPKLEDVAFIVPMPASKARARQPVTEVANALGGIVNLPVFDGLLTKAITGKSLKDLPSKAEKIAALAGTFNIVDQIAQQGRWNVLLVDDLYDSGASMEAACAALRTYQKVNRVYVAALTWS